MLALASPWETSCSHCNACWKQTPSWCGYCTNLDKSGNNKVLVFSSRRNVIRNVHFEWVTSTCCITLLQIDKPWAKGKPWFWLTLGRPSEHFEQMFCTSGKYPEFPDNTLKKIIFRSIFHWNKRNVSNLLHSNCTDFFDQFTCLFLSQGIQYRGRLKIC